MLTSNIDEIDKYDYLVEKFKKGYGFLRTADLKSLPVGRAEIDGDEVFASVQEYVTMPKEECRFEAHNKYFDIQYVVEGEELFGYAKRVDLTEAEAYQEADDIVFLNDPDSDGSILLKAGDCAVVSPEDAHKPRCESGSPCKVKKIVVKVKM